MQTSLTCDVVASKLVFATQPAHGGGPTLLHGTSFETQPVLEAQDADGARDHHAIGQVALSVHTGNAALTGQTSRDWTSGLADFSANSLTLSAQNDGERVVLRAEADGLPPSSATPSTSISAPPVWPSPIRRAYWHSTMAN